MANYLQVIENVTVSSGNHTQSFVAGELVSPYSMWAEPLSFAGAVVDSGQPAPVEEMTPTYAYRTTSNKYLPIFQIADLTKLMNFDFLKSEVHGTAASAQTFTLPSNNNTRMGVGGHFWVRQMGAGVITIDGQAGVTIRAPFGVSTSARYSSLFCIKVGADEWVVIPQGGSGGGGGTVDTDDQTAAQVPFTPTGAISATTVQAALAELDAEKQAISAKGVANGYAGLDATGKVPTAQLPALALTDVHVVADTTARNALVVEEGDVAIVTGTGAGSYIWDGGQWLSIGGAGASEVASNITLTPTGDVSATTVQSGIAELAAEKQPISAKGVANGYAGLGADGKVPAAQLPPIETIESIQDMIATFLVAGSNVTLAYDDVTGKLTISAAGGTGGGLTMEEIQDNLATSFFVGGQNVTFTYDDVNNTFTIDSPAGAVGDGATIEEMQDNLGTSFLQAGAQITLSYDDVANTLTIASTAPTLEAIHDNLGTQFLQAGTGVTLTYDDAGNVLTISAPTSGGHTMEEIQDNMATFLTAGTGIGLIYDDAAGTLTINSTATSEGTSNPLLMQGAQVKLTRLSTGWHLPGSTAPVDLTGRVASITWEGTAAQIPAQGTAVDAFRVGDTALIRTTAL